MKYTRLEKLAQAEPWTLNGEDGAYVRSVLSDRQADPEERILALELAGDTVLMNDEMAETVLAVLGDAGEDEKLRGKAAIVLGPSLELASDDEMTEEVDDPSCPLSPPMVERVEQALNALFDDGSAPKEVRRRCLEAAVRLPRDWQKKAIRQAYRSGDELWKITAVFCMRFIEGFDDRILETLESEDPDLLFTALQSAGERALEASWPRVRQILQKGEGDRDVLAVAMSAAASIRPSQAKQLIAPYLQNSDPELREAAENALSEAEIMMGGLDFEADDGFLPDWDGEDDEWEEGLDGDEGDEPGAGAGPHPFPIPGRPSGGGGPLPKAGKPSGPKKEGQKKNKKKKRP